MAVRKGLRLIEIRAVDGARISKKNAARYGRHLYKLSGGRRLTAEQVVADARHPTSPTHKYFEWRDRQAAHRYRLEQARELMRFIEVVLEDGKGQELTMRLFHNVVLEDASRVFAPMDLVASRVDLTQQILAQAKAELIAWENKYRNVLATHKAWRFIKQGLNKL